MSLKEIVLDAVILKAQNIKVCELREMLLIAYIIDYAIYTYTLTFHFSISCGQHNVFIHRSRLLSASFCHNLNLLYLLQDKTHIHILNNIEISLDDKPLSLNLLSRSPSYFLILHSLHKKNPIFLHKFLMFTFSSFLFNKYIAFGLHDNILQFILSWFFSNISHSDYMIIDANLFYLGYFLI